MMRSIIVAFDDNFFGEIDVFHVSQKDTYLISGTYMSYNIL